MPLPEQYFPVLNRYSVKTVSKMPVTESQIKNFFKKHPEKMLENQPDAGMIRSVKHGIATHPLRGVVLNGKEHRERKAQAMIEHKTAMAKLYRHEKIAELAKKEAKKNVVKNRRLAMAKIIKTGGTIQLTKDNSRLMIPDVTKLRESGLKIVLFNNLGKDKKYYKADGFISHITNEKLTTKIKNSTVRQKLLAALNSNELLTIDVFASSKQAVAQALRALAREERIDIYTVTEGNETLGWISPKAGQ